MFGINTDFSNFAVFWFFVLGIGLYFFVRFLKMVAPYLLDKIGYRKSLDRVFVLVSVGAWVLFFIWAVEFFMGRHQIFAALLLAGLVFTLAWAAWFSKDFVAGYIFRLSDKFSVKETIVVDGNEGKIRVLEKRGVLLETSTGEQVYIPYSKVLGKSITKRNPAQKILSKTIVLRMDASKPVNENIKVVKSAIQSLPWVSLTKKSKVNLLEEYDDGYSIEVTYFVVDKKYFHKVANFLKERFEGKS